MEDMKRWARAAAVRAVKTAAQSATTTMGGVDWAVVGSTALLAAILSALTSVAGIPEVADGASVAAIRAAGDGE